MNTWGNHIKITIFGESHGEFLGITIDGLKPGLEINHDYIKDEINRRSTKNKIISTQRLETDEYKIISGVFNNKTTGAPLTVLFPNKNIKSKDYEKIKDLVRPSHADFPAKIKFNGYNDFRGGGTFSGRLTLPIVFVGALAKQILLEKNIKIYSHIKQISHFSSCSLLHREIDENLLQEIKNYDLPFLDKNLSVKAKKYVEQISLNGDSIGGIIECICLNLPIGLGEPFFESFESKLASIIFSIPSIKGIEFGLGFNYMNGTGKELNDQYILDENKAIRTSTNNNGGILGGLTTGMPVIFSVIVKPTPSISLPQKSINMKTMTEEIIKIEGRHDACIVPRILPVIEAVTAITILDLIQ